MHALSISLLAVLLMTLAGCGEKAAGDKSGVASTVTITKDLIPEEKFAKTKKAAEAGDPAAQVEITFMYLEGNGVPKDDAKVEEWIPKVMANLDWLLKSSAQGDARAQFVLALKYDKGFGVPKDKAKSMEWLLKSAAQGFAMAQYSLGSEYHYGVPKNSAKAMEWYLKAAAQGECFCAR